MKIRKECFGKIVNHQCPNGVKLQFEIKESDAHIYKKLGLDVFEKEQTKSANVVEEKPKKNATKEVSNK